METVSFRLLAIGLVSRGPPGNLGPAGQTDHFCERLVDALVVAIVALGLAFLLMWSAKLCLMHNADSILPALVSTQNVTWYYWGQNRFGNLLPALTSWIWDVDLNLKAQILLRAFCAALGPVFFILVLRPKARLIPVYCATIAAMIFLERDLLAHWYWTDAQPYGTSLALLAPSLLVVTHSWRFNAGSAGIAILVLFLLMVALWVNLSAVLFALPLFLGLAVVDRSRQFLALAVLLALAYGLDSAHAAHVERNFAYAALRPSWAATLKAVSNLADEIRGLPMLLLAAGAILASWTLRSRQIVRTASLMLAVSALVFLVTANLQWVQENLSLSRYFLIPVTATVATCATLVVEAAAKLMAQVQPWNRLLLPSVSLALLILAAALIVLPLNLQCRFVAGPPELAAAVDLVDKTNASFVDGDYWLVWPAVFLANRNARGPIFGLAYRAEGARRPIRNFAASHPHPVILCIGKSLTDCVDRFASTLGWKRVSAREIASGELADSRLNWVAGVLDYGSQDDSAARYR
jgi:hypothetical protein